MFNVTLCFIVLCLCVMFYCLQYGYWVLDRWVNVEIKITRIKLKEWAQVESSIKIFRLSQIPLSLNQIGVHQFESESKFKGIVIGKNKWRLRFKKQKVMVQASKRLGSYGSCFPKWIEELYEHTVCRTLPVKQNETTHTM